MPATEQAQGITANDFVSSMTEAIKGPDPKYDQYRTVVKQMVKDYDGKPHPNRQQIAQYMLDHVPNLSQQVNITDLTPSVTGGPPRYNVGAKTGDRTSAKGEATGGGLTTAIGEFARPGMEKVVGAVTGAIPKLVGAPKGVSDFSTGFGKGLADVGVDLTSPVNIALGASMLLPESWISKVSSIPKAARLLNGLKTIGKYGFASVQAVDALKEVPAALEAYQKGDMTAAGQEMAKAMADVVLVKMAVSSGKKAKAGTPSQPPSPGDTSVRTKETVKMGERDIPVTERTNPELAAKVSAERAKKSGPATRVGKPAAPTTPEAIERRIGDIQDAMSRMPRGTPDDNAAYDAAEAEIRQLRSIHPATSLDPAVAAKRTMAELDEAKAKQGAVRAQAPQLNQPPLPPASEPAGSAAKREAEAKARADSQRTPVADLGYRVAPEETGELPKQQGPQKTAVGIETPPQPPAPLPATPKEDAASTIDGSKAPPTAEGQQFIAQRLPGIPQGATVVFRESTPKGIVVDVLDSNGNVSQTKTLPYTGSVWKMEQTGRIKVKAASKKPAPPPAPPPEPPPATPSQPPQPHPTPTEPVSTPSTPPTSVAPPTPEASAPPPVPPAGPPAKAAPLAPPLKPGVPKKPVQPPALPAEAPPAHTFDSVVKWATDFKKSNTFKVLYNGKGSPEWITVFGRGKATPGVISKQLTELVAEARAKGHKMVEITPMDEDGKVPLGESIKFDVGAAPAK